MSNLSKLKKQQADILGKLSSDVDNVGKTKTTPRQDDDRYWKPVGGEDGNGTFTIRFLPAVDGEDKEFIHYWTYRFKWIPTGKYYYARSLSTIGKTDPVVEKKKEFREAGNETATKMMGRQDKYVSNILVIKDSHNPDNEGKVFLYEYGTQIFNKIKDAIAGDPESERDGFNPFDPWEGRNFIVKLIKKAEFPNFEKSSFSDKATAIGKDSYIEEIWAKQFSLEAEAAEDKYEEYEVLKQRLDNVLRPRGENGNSSNASKPAPRKAASSEEADDVNVDDEVDVSSEVDTEADIDDILKNI